jgi:hypothetical protein
MAEQATPQAHLRRKETQVEIMLQPPVLFRQREGEGAQERSVKTLEIQPVALMQVVMVGRELHPL